MSLGKVVSIEEALIVACKVCDAVAKHTNGVTRGYSIPDEHCLSVGNRNIGILQVAGSIRRKRPFVRDIDIIINTNYAKNIWEAFIELGDPIRRGYDGQIIGVIVDGLKVEITPASLESWGAALMYRTGSVQFNIQQRAKAKGMRYLLNGEGLWDRQGKYIAGTTEIDLFNALHLDWVPPAERR